MNANFRTLITVVAIMAVAFIVYSLIQNSNVHDLINEDIEDLEYSIDSVRNHVFDVQNDVDKIKKGGANGVSR